MGIHDFTINHWTWPLVAGIHGQMARRRHLRASLPPLLGSLCVGCAAGAALHLATAETRQPAAGRSVRKMGGIRKEEKAVWCVVFLKKTGVSIYFFCG